MSYCPRPAKSSKTNFTTPAKKTVNAPAPRKESCGPSSSTVVTGGGSSTSTTVYVPGPAGPMGPAGPAGADGKDGWGFKWEGQFELNKQYKKQQDSNPLASVVEYAGSSWIAVEDNISTDQDNPEHEPGNSASWQLVAQAGAGSNGSIAAPGFDFFNLQDYYDWFKNASVSEIVDAAIAGVGIVLAGAVVTDMLTDDGVGDGEANQTYTGSAGYVVSSYTAPTLPAVITSLCAVAGKTADVSLLDSVPCEFTIGNSNSVSNILKTLSLVYGFDMVDVGTSIKFMPRSATPVKTLSADDFGFTDGTEPLSRFAASRAQGITLARTVTFKYLSRALDYNQFTQRAEIYTFEDGQDVTIEAPLTLDDTFAKEVAELNLLNSHLERQQYLFPVSYKHLDLECGDVFDSPYGLMRVRRVNEQRDGLLELTCVEAGGEEAVSGTGAVASVPPISTNIPVLIGYSQALAIDPPALGQGDQGVRAYLAVHGYDAPGWPGASIYISTNNGASYDFAGTQYSEATVGLVALATPSRDYTVWDETTTISVQLKTNSLVSRSALDVLNGKNWALIGKEVIGFRNAVLTGPKTYTLSGLLRGRYGSEQHVGTHVTNELFTLLDENLYRLTLNTEERGKVLKVKAVTIGSSLDKSTESDVQWFSTNTIPWTPINTKLLKVGADYQFTWGERARFNNQLRDLSESPRDVDWGGSTVIIYEPDGVTVKKTYLTTSYVFTYTSAMQTSDFGSPQSSLKAAIAQYSQAYGVGYPIAVEA